MATPDPNVPNVQAYATSGVTTYATVNRRMVKTQTLTIASSATTSDACDQSHFIAAGFVMPSTFTGTSVTFQVSADGVTYQSLYDSTNTQVSVTVAVSRSYAAPAALAAWPFFKIVSGSTEGQQDSIVVVLKA